MSGGNSIIANDGNIGSNQAELLVEIPGKRVKVVDHENIELSSQMGRESDWFFGHWDAKDRYREPNDARRAL